jgi:nitroreductase
MALLQTNTQPILTVMDALYQRRAVRNFTKQGVSKEQITTLLDAAAQAPSAMNRQPWAFLVIQDRTLLTRISDSAKKRILEDTDWASNLEHKHIPLDDPNFDIFYGATSLVVICRHDEEGFSPEGDCYLAGQNLMLAAHAMGLATCPIGFARDILQTQGLRDELSVPTDYWPVLPIVVGYPKGVTEPSLRKISKVLAWR